MSDLQIGGARVHVDRVVFRARNKKIYRADLPRPGAELEIYGDAPHPCALCGTNMKKVVNNFGDYWACPGCNTLWDNGRGAEDGISPQDMKALARFRGQDGWSYEGVQEGNYKWANGEEWRAIEANKRASARRAESDLPPIDVPPIHGPRIDGGGTEGGGGKINKSRKRRKLSKKRKLFRKRRLSKKRKSKKKTKRRRRP